MVIAWLVFGVLLLLFELHHLAFYALFGALGAFGAAAVALVAPDAVAVQAVVAVGLALAGVVAVRPLVSRVFEHHHLSEATRGVHGGLVGQEALALDTVGDDHRAGHVRLAGERWLAISGHGSIAAGTTVLVTAVQGTTLVVWPLDGVGGLPPALPDQTAQPGRADQSGQADRHHEEADGSTS